MNDLDLRLEWKALLAHKAWLKGDPLPGMQSATKAGTDNFDDIEWLIANDLWDWGDDEPEPSSEWDEVDPHSIIPPSKQ